MLCMLGGFWDRRNPLWKELHTKGLLVQRPPQDMASHKIKPKDRVLTRTWKEASLTPRWEESYVVLLTTETAVRTVERRWTHASRVKRPISPEAGMSWKVTSTPGDLKITLKR